MSAEVEKEYEKIDEKLGDGHIRRIIENLSAIDGEDGQQAMSNLIQLHNECQQIFSQLPGPKSPKRRLQKPSPSPAAKTRK